MPPGKQRSEYIFILDACSSTDFLRNTLDQIFVDKSLSDAKNDNAKVILLNFPSPEGSNFTVLNLGCDVPFTNNVVFNDLEQHIPNLPAPLPNKSAWTDVIRYACSSFEPMSDDKYVRTFILVLISDFKTVTESLISCKEVLNKLDVELVAVVEENVSYSHRPILVKKDLNQAMENVKVPEGIDSKGVQYMYELLQSVDGVLTGPGDLLKFMSFLRVPPRKQDWNVKVLQVGSYEFHTLARKIIDDDNSMVSREITRGEFEYIPASKLDNVGDVDMSARQETVDEDKMVDADVFHGQPVVVPVDVTNAMVESNVATFKVLGFVSSELPEVYYGGEETHAVCANDKSKRCFHFLELVQKMLEMDKYAIAMRVYRARTEPSLFVLIPKKGGWLLMTNLAEEARSYVCPLLPDDEPVNVEKLPAGMAALRQHLLDRAPTSLFHPRADVGVHQLAVVDNVRRMCGYNTDFYTPVQHFDLAAGISQETKATLDAIFKRPEGQSAQDFDDFVKLRDEDEEEEEDDW